jgi:4'-phosphopantetheinyl transferase
MTTATDIDIWRIDQRLGTAEHGVLSAAERERAERLLHPDRAEAFRNRHAALRAILAARIGCHPGALAFSTGPSGKPTARGPDGTERIPFSLSDSGSIAVIAVADHDAIGIDVEGIRSVNRLEALAARYFAEPETRALLALDPALRSTAFLRCWTRKEAVMKAHGAGLALGLRRVATGFATDEPRHVDVDGQRYWLRDINLGDDCCAALAATAPIGHVRLHAF